MADGMGYKQQQQHEEEAEALTHQRHHPGKRRKCLVCCGITSAIILLLIIVLIILGVTLLKPKEPKISLESVRLQTFNLSLNLLSPSLTVVIDMGVSVKNPNRASFRYSDSISHITYRGVEVAQALIPAGKIAARGTEHLTTNVTIHADKFISNSNLLPDITSGSIPISTNTVVSGRVTVLNIIKRHATSSSVCNITISVANRSVENLQCTQKTKL